MEANLYVFAWLAGPCIRGIGANRPILGRKCTYKGAVKIVEKQSPRAFGINNFVYLTLDCIAFLHY